jgi:hypothetical protein
MDTMRRSFGIEVAKAGLDLFMEVRQRGFYGG